jgi:hypothetical protein
MPTACEFIMFALDDEFRLWEGIVIACMVYIEMSTYEEINIVRTQLQIGEMLKHIFFVLSWGSSCRWYIVRRESTIDEYVLPIVGLNKIAARRPWSWGSRWDGRSS